MSVFGYICFTLTTSDSASCSPRHSGERGGSHHKDKERETPLLNKGLLGETSIPESCWFFMLLDFLRGARSERSMV